MAYMCPSPIPASDVSLYSRASSAASDDLLISGTRPVAVSDGKRHGLRTLPGFVRDWARKQWRLLRPPKPRVAPEKPLWWLRMQYNLVLSPLYRLPDELVLAICRNLEEGSDVYIMRQVCSLFRRIMSSAEFVRSVQMKIIVRCGRPIVDFPRLRVDWEDVFERLRRRRCCSACIDARLPKHIGGDSAYDAVMLRMANETRYCVRCQTRHPLIMFSHAQRNVSRGAICVMAEGGVAICPHHTISLDKLRDWQGIIRRRGDGQKTPPWLLRCELCFQDLEEPLRSLAYQPSATYLLPGAAKTAGTEGALCVQWTMPLRVDAKKQWPRWTRQCAGVGAIRTRPKQKRSKRLWPRQ
ncbi:hypothetical protein PG993_008616 [Apiospora rasikravindrae]|uniref:F-box domain-containing protein n=1 Tax=Apiospora rasikravindrae TaxID=990691 RepID=A0ABR1T2M5_9PEZI